MAMAAGLGRRAVLYVSRLQWTVGAEDLKQYFSNFGKVLKAEIKFDDRGISKGYGFVAMASEEDVESIIATAGHRIEGRAVNVQRKVASKPRQASGHPDNPIVTGD